jgi:hypothetical protein
MKKTFTLFACLFILFSLNSQTKISNKQEVSGTWKKSKSPYIIEGEAIVPEGKTLNIKPGVVIQFRTGEDKDYRIEGTINPNFNCGFLRVNGNIIAKGKKNALIKFTNNGPGTWGNVSIYSKSNKNFLQYCWFESAFYVRSIVKMNNAWGEEVFENATGALTFNNASGTVKNCLFINNGWTAINCKNGSNPKLINLTIVGNEYAIECNSKSSPEIANTIIWSNSNSFYVNGEATTKISYSLMPEIGIPENLQDGGNNIKGVLPEFVNQEENNFELKKESPAFKKGKGGVNIGAL